MLHPDRIRCVKVPNLEQTMAELATDTWTGLVSTRKPNIANTKELSGEIQRWSQFRISEHLLSNFERIYAREMI